MSRALDLFNITHTQGVPQPNSEHLRSFTFIRGEILNPQTFAETRLGFQPEPQQVPVFQARTSKGILCCNRQFGKSNTITALAIHRAYYHPGSLLVIISPTSANRTSFC